MTTHRVRYNRWTWWLLVLMLLVLLLMWLFGTSLNCCDTNTQGQIPTENSLVDTADQTANTPLQVDFTADKVTLTGDVATQAEHDTLMQALYGHYDAANITDKLTIHANSTTQTLTLTGAVESQAVADTLVNNLQAALPNYTIDNQLTVIAAPIADATAIDCEHDNDKLALAIRFDTGSATLQNNDKALLNASAACLGDTKYVIEGHSDTVGNADFNLQLSQKRADAVKAYLVDQGANAAQLTTQAYGQTKPIAPNTTEAGRKLNRRIEIVKVQP